MLTFTYRTPTAITITPETNVPHLQRIQNNTSMARPPRIKSLSIAASDMMMLFVLFVFCG